MKRLELVTTDYDLYFHDNAYYYLRWNLIYCPEYDRFFRRNFCGF